MPDFERSFIALTVPAEMKAEPRTPTKEALASAAAPTTVLGVGPLAELLFACAFCGSKHVSAVFSFPDSRERPTRIYQCRCCSCLLPRYDLVPTEAEMRKLQTGWEGLWHEFTPAEADTLVADCSSMVEYYRPWLASDGGLVLELGAGRGGLMKALQNRGFAVKGCEPTSHTARLARELYGFDGDTLAGVGAEEFLNQIATSGEAVQAVFMWHVLEHMFRPLGLLRRIATILKPGGLLIGQVPLFAQDYIYETHLFFMNEPAILFAAEQSGFLVEQINYDHGRKYTGFILRRNEKVLERGDGANRDNASSSPTEDDWLATFAVIARAGIHIKKGRWKEAVLTLQPSLDQLQREPHGLRMWARALDGIGQADDAVAAWQQLLALDPTDADARRRLNPRPSSELLPYE